MALRFRTHLALRSAVALLALAVSTPADLLAATAAASDAVNLDVMTQIRQEGFHNSKVMEIESQLTDVIGPRLTGSPAMKRANEWTRDQFTEWGLVNAHLESFAFGRGWANEYTDVRMVAPQASPLLAYPKAWTVSTDGVLRAPVMKAKLATQADLDKYKGQLAGKIVLNGDMREVKPQSKPALERFDDKKLAELAQYEIPSEKPSFNREQFAQRILFQKTLNQVRSRRVVTRSRFRPTGKYPSWKMERMLQWESINELNAFRLLDCDPRVTVFTEQPCEIVYFDGTETKRHYPDIYVEIDSHQELWEVKAECEASQSEVSTRTGCEGTISVLKRRHGLTRCRYKGKVGMKRWVGLAEISDNLINLGRALAR